MVGRWQPVGCMAVMAVMACGVRVRATGSAPATPGGEPVASASAPAQPPLRPDCPPPFRRDDPEIGQFVVDVVNTLAHSWFSAECLGPKRGEPLVLVQWTEDQPGGDRTVDEFHIDGTSLQTATLRWARISVERRDQLRTSFQNEADPRFTDALYIERVDAWVQHDRTFAADGHHERSVRRATTVVIPLAVNDQASLELYATARHVASLDFSAPPPQVAADDGNRWAIYPKVEAPAASSATPPAPSASATASPSAPSPVPSPATAQRHRGKKKASSALGSLQPPSFPGTLMLEPRQIQGGSPP